jgi:Sec-independent protein translocase protein TatA
MNKLPAAIGSFVASHLELKKTLTRAKEEMDAAAKAAQEEARNKARNAKKPSADKAGKTFAFCLPFHSLPRYPAGMPAP